MKFKKLYNTLIEDVKVRIYVDGIWIADLPVDSVMVDLMEMRVIGVGTASSDKGSLIVVWLEDTTE